MSATWPRRAPQPAQDIAVAEYRSAVREAHERVERLTESMRAPLGRCTLQPSRLSHRHTDDGTIETETFFIDQPRNPPQRPSLRRETRRQ